MPTRDAKPSPQGRLLEIPDEVLAHPDPRWGRDELNIINYPWWIVKTRRGDNTPHTIDIVDGNKEWHVEGSLNWGLPQTSDVDFYVVMMELTHELGWPNPVGFVTYALLERLGLDSSGKSYDQVRTSCERLTRVTISTNHFWERTPDTAKRGRWTTRKGFHILARYELTTREDYLARRGDPTSYVWWDPVILASCKARYMKRLDVALYQSFRTAYARFLYRFLDKEAYRQQDCLEFDLVKLGLTHLGMPANYAAPSRMKEKLGEAFDELVAKGVLTRYEYVETGPRRKDPVLVRFHFGPRRTPKFERPSAPQLELAEGNFNGGNLPASPETAQIPLDLDLLARLAEAGVEEPMLSELVACYPDECRKKLARWPWAGVRGPGALIQAIREGWTLPDERVVEQEQRRRGVVQRRQKQLNQEVQEGLAAKEEGLRFDDWFKRFPPEEQAQYRDEAAELLAVESPQASRMYRQKPMDILILGQLIQVTGWNSSPENPRQVGLAQQ